MLKGRGTKYFREDRERPSPPEPLADLLFCEALEFRILPWQLDDLDVQTYAYWSQVIGTYRDEKAKRESQRDKQAQADAKKGRRR